MDTDLLQGFYLAELFVNPRDGQVSGPSGTRHLPPRAAEVLLCLASQPGEVVAREELLSRVWGEGRGSAESLSHAVSEIRHALDDDAEHPTFIQTLPRRGYRLLVSPAARRSAAHPAGEPPQREAAPGEPGLIENLSRRGVFEAAVAYLVLGWLLIQISDIVFDRLLFPDWAATFVTSFVIAGFPIAIALSWFLEFRDGRAMIHELSPQDASRRRFSRRYIAVIGALAIAAVIVTAYDRSIGLPQIATLESADAGSLPPIADNTIGVLPFFNVDGSEETAIFANGLVDDVLTGMTRVPGLAVASRGDSFTLEPNSASTRVRERLRVAQYVEGSIETNGENMRVTVQLIDSASGFHMLSRTFDVPPAEYFRMRDEVTRLIVANVRVALPPETRSVEFLSVPDPGIDVYVLYRRGVDASRAADMAGSIDSIQAWFDMALAIDPGYAAAHAGKCSAYVDAYPVTFESAYIAEAEASCAAALRLNPNLDVVYSALGKLYQATGRYERSESAYLAALEIDPSSSVSLIGLGEVYRLQQRLEEAEDSLRRAAGLHPGDWSAFNALGNFLYRSGRYSEAAEQYRNVIALDDANARAQTNLATSLMLAGEFEAAEPAYRRAIELEGDASAFTNLGLLLFYAGRYAEAIEAHRRAVGLSPQDYLAHSNLGDTLRVAGQQEESRQAFGTARELAQAALSVNPNDAFILMDLAWINAVLGELQRSSELMTRAKDAVPDDPYVHYIDGLIHNLSGDSAGAIGALQRAVDNGYSTQMLAADPNLQSLRGAAGFGSVLARTD